MKAVLTINDIVNFYLPLDDAITVATILKDSLHVAKVFVEDTYKVKEKDAVITIAVLHESEAAKWLL